MLAKIFKHATNFPQSPNFEAFLLYLPLLFLIFPQESGFFHARAIFWLFPFLFYWVITSKPRRTNKHFYIYSLLWVFFLASSLLSTLFSASRGFSIIKIAEYLGVFLYSIYFYLIIDNQQKLRFFSHLIILTGLILVVLSTYLQLLVDHPTIGGINLFYPNHGHNHIASFMLLAIPITLAQALTTKNRRSLILHSLFLILFFSQLLLSFSRAAYLVLPISLLAFAWTLKPKKLSLKLQTCLAILTTLPLAFIIAISIVSVFSTQLNQLSPGIIKTNWLLRQTLKPVSGHRTAYWTQALQSFRDHPVFGYGPGTFRLTSKLYRQQVGDFTFFPHNYLLKILSEQGIVGMVSFTTLLVFSFRVVILNLFQDRKRKQVNPTSLGLFVGTTSLFLHSLLDFDFNFLIIITLFFSVLAIFLRFSQKPTSFLTKSSNTLITCHLSLVTFPLFLFGLFYTASSTLSLISNLNRDNQPVQTHNFSQLALTLFPFDEDLAAQYISDLSTTGTPINSTLLQLILFFHHHNPQIHQSLADHYHNQQYFDKFISHSETAISLDPINTTNHQELVDYYLSINHSCQATTSIFGYYLMHYHLFPNSDSLSLDSTTHHPNHSLPLDFCHLKNHSQLKHLSNLSLPNKELNFSKLFYQLGFEQLSTSPNTTLYLWQLATFTSPQWSYFHIDLANLYHQIHQDNQAIAQLEYCQKYAAPQQHCRDYQQSIANNNTFDQPGTQLQFINSLP